MNINTSAIVENLPIKECFPSCLSISLEFQDIEEILVCGMWWCYGLFDGLFYLISRKMIV